MPTKRNKPPPWQKNLDVRSERDRHRDKLTDGQTDYREVLMSYIFMVLLSGPPRTLRHWTRLHIVQEQVQVCCHHQGRIL